MNVLVIPEDFRKDQYILKPIMEAMLTKLGKPRAKVIVLKDPLLGGIAEALRWETLEDIINRYKGMIHLFLLLVDRDGVTTRREALTAIESKARPLLQAGRCLLGENAWQELEVWALAAQTLPKEWAWKDVQAHLHPKEHYFAPFAEQRGLADEPGEGRLTMGLEAAKSYARVRKLCSQDLGALESRVKHFIATGSYP